MPRTILPRMQPIRGNVISRADFFRRQQDDFERVPCKTPAYHFTTGTDSLRLGELYTGNVQVYVMSPTGSNAGLPAGAPTLTANKWEVVTVTLNNSNLLVDSTAVGVDLYLYAFRYNGNTYYINMGAPTLRNVPVFNGLSQYGQFAVAQTYIGDFGIEITAVLPTVASGARALFGGSDNTSTSPTGFMLYTDAGSNNIQARIPTTAGFSFDLRTPLTPHLGGTHRIGVSRVAGVWQLLIGGAVYDTYDSNANGVINQSVRTIASRAGALLYQGTLYDYRDSLGNHYPLDDGFANNPVMRNAGTGTNGTFVNMTAAAWDTIIV